MKTIITYGTFDLLHQGHINLLKNAKALGDVLIVGVTSEYYDRSRGKLNVAQSTEERINALKKFNFIDKIIVEEHKGQKKEDIEKYNVDIFTIGSDWEGYFDYLETDNCKVHYLPRTEGISSTEIRNDTIKDIKIGIIGVGRIAKRFALELLHVEGVSIKSVFSRNISSVNIFLHENSLLYGFDDFESFLSSGIDAVYIASPHETHFQYAKKSLEKGLHVLCEKPLALKSAEIKELQEISKQNHLTFMEAIKTAYTPAFIKLIEEINNGVIGEVKDIKATFTKLITDKSCREFQSPYGGATNELASYPLLLAEKIWGKSPQKNYYFDCSEDNVDIINRIISDYGEGRVATATVGIGVKSEGECIISGTKGYIYIPAPWWLTRKFFVRFEDIHKEIEYSFEYDGDGLRYEISEFISLIQRKNISSSYLSIDNSIAINSIMEEYHNQKIK